MERGLHEYVLLGFHFAVVDTLDHDTRLPTVTNCRVVGLFSKEIDAESYCEWLND
jgi:hypothetical protein